MASEEPAKVVGIWKTEIVLRVHDLRYRLRTAIAHREEVETRELGQKEFDAHAEAVHQHLAYACEMLFASTRWWQFWGRTRAWWTGETVTAAWDSVHGAEAELVAIGSRDELLAPVPVLRLWMRQLLSDDLKVKRYERVLDEIAYTREAPDRTALRQIYIDTIAANTEWYKSLRAFRNLLFAVASGLAIAVVVIALWHAIDPSFVALCDSSEARAICFGGGTNASTRDAVMQITLAGAVGGLLSSAFLLTKIDHTPSRYNLLAPQVVLKVLVGAVGALVGVLLVQSQLINLVGGDSTADLLAYAASFGFSQQLLTQFVDKRAGDLLGGQRE